MRTDDLRYVCVVVEFSNKSRYTIERDIFCFSLLNRLIDFLCLKKRKIATIFFTPLSKSQIKSFITTYLHLKCHINMFKTDTIFKIVYWKLDFDFILQICIYPFKPLIDKVTQVELSISWDYMIFSFYLKMWLYFGRNSIVTFSFNIKFAK